MQYIFVETKRKINGRDKVLPDSKTLPDTNNTIALKNGTGCGTNPDLALFR